MAKGAGPRPMHFEKAKDAKGTIKRLWQYLKQYKIKLIIVFVFIVVNVALNILSTILLAPVIDEYIIPMITYNDSNEYLYGFIKILVTLFLVVLGISITQFIQMKIMISVSQNTVKQMRTDLFAKIEKLPVSFFDTHKSGELMSRITNDLDNVSNALNTSINQVISGILTIIISLIAMLSISLKLTIVCIITIPIMIFIVAKINKLVRKQFNISQQCLGDVNGYIEEYISGQKVIKAFNKEESVKENFQIINEKFRNQAFKAQAFSAVVMPIMGSINNICTAIIAVLSGIFAIQGKITIGQIATFNKFARNFSHPINEISQQFSVIQLGLAGAERMFEIIDEKVEYENDRLKPQMKEVIGKVEFRNVSFGYDEQLVLKNVSFVAMPGQTIAIVGPTGAGKTTIINLLTRFYNVLEGEILIDDVNIKDVNIYSLREKLGIVLQDTVLFSENIEENIRFGKLDATKEEVVECAKISNAHGYIKRLSNGYETILAEDATNISVGQKQLLNIARVALNNPEILILDEATSNVDTRTEVKIQEAMNTLLKGRTSFVIAHRLSTIRNADKILVINDGRIVEQGSHDELINEKGMYYVMYSGLSQNSEV